MTSLRTALLGALAGACLLGGCSDGGTSAPQAIQHGTTIELADGTIEGEVAGGTRRFLGIPFAAPPVGVLRWRPPRPPAPWAGTLPTKAFSSACPHSVRSCPVAMV